MTDLVYKDCNVRIGSRDLKVDLILLNMRDFDVIIGMDWLSKYKATVDCHKKSVQFMLPEQVVISFD